MLYNEIMKLSPLKSANLKDKAVILRVDFNVPMEDEKILDDSRIKAALPTIEYILNQGAKKLILISWKAETEQAE